MSKPEDGSSHNRRNFTFRLSPPDLPQLSLRRIFMPSSSGTTKSGTNGGGSSWRQRLRILTNSDQANDGTRSEGGVSQYSAPSFDTRSTPTTKNQSKGNSKQLPVTTAITRTHSTRSSSSNQKQECSMCFQQYTDENSRMLTNCDHKFCLECLLRYVTTEVSEGRANLACPEPACQSKLHPSDVAAIVGLKSPMYKKYEEFLLRRCLMADPDTRWCPAPDCGFAVIAAGCAECPQLRCERPGCGTSFCYHCKQIWHPNVTCEVARVRRAPAEFSAISSDLVNKDDIKACPRCGVFILKADDGSCNHMSCRLCGAEFCWLCMKLVTDVHYLSPSGCTFWGKKRWSRKKKLFWQLGLLAGAPVGIVLLTAIAIPAIMAGFPIWTGRKIRQKHRNSTAAARNAAIAGGVVGATLAAPAIAAAAVGVGVPVLLAYVYGVVPVSLCRSGSVGAKESKNHPDSIDRRNDVEAIIAAINSPASPINSGDRTQMLYPDKASNAAMAGTLSIASVEAVISGELNSQTEPDPGSWHLSVDTAAGVESDGHEERVTLDSYRLPRHILLCDKPMRSDVDTHGMTSADGTGCGVSVAEPSLAGSISSSLAARRLMVRSTRGTSASTESIGASYGEDHYSGVCQSDSASASVRALTGSMSKLASSQAPVQNNAQISSSNTTAKITSSLTAAPSQITTTPSGPNHHNHADLSLSSPSPVSVEIVTPSTCDCEVVCHEVPPSSP